MFNRNGRVACSKCEAPMRPLDISRGAALFKCDDCNSYIVYRFGGTTHRVDGPESAYIIEQSPGED
jgi:transposase-like protein